MSALEIVQPTNAPTTALAPPPQPAAIVTPMQMLAAAVDRGADIATIERLAALAERMESQAARRAFDEAIAAAKSEIPVIRKNRAVDFTSAKGRTNYRHEDLAEIARVVSPILAKHGLSYRFRSSVENGVVLVTCVVSHRDGHSEENSLMAGRDESGNKNSIQAIGSTITYLQRYTLKAALGLAAADDDDGKASGQNDDDRPRLNADQIKALRDLISAADTTEAAFCEHVKVEALADIYAENYPKACRILEQRIARGRA